MKADDLDSVTDPSKLSESDFAPGTKWTPAGWTRSNPKYVAKESNITLTDADFSNNPELQDKTVSIQQCPWIGFKGNWTIDKNQIKQGNRILLSAIKFRDDFSLNKGNNNEIFEANWRNTGVSFKGDKIGNISLHNDNGNEWDIYLDVTTNKNYATDPQLTFNMFSCFGINSSWMDYRPMQQLANKNDKLRIITNNKIYRYTITKDKTWTKVPSQNWKFTSTPFPNTWYQNIYEGDHTWNPFLTKNNIYNNSNSVDTNKIVTYNLKLSGINLPNKITDFIIQPRYILFDGKDPLGSDGHENIIEGSLSQTQESAHPKIVKLQDNLSSKDVQDATPLHGIAYSIQKDGSIVLCHRANYRDYIPHVNDDSYINSIKISYPYNIGYGKNKESVIDSTLQHIKKNSYEPDVLSPIILTSGARNDIPTVWTLTNLDTGTQRSSSTGINDSSFNAELYRTALVHYLDSKTDNNISNDSIMGTKNNSTDYKLNIPKGYILDTKSGKNKNGTQYKWSADKKSIAYTFADDQAVNKANPINIYITHGTHTTNDNSGHATRTITYTGLPDNLKPKDNSQTINFTRTVEVDDVTGAKTPSAWKPVTGNGHYTAVTSPTFAGYRPDQDVILDEAATPNKNETVTVNYSRTDQNAKLTVHDDTANTDLNDYAENSTGLYQDQINFKTAPSAVEQELKDKGYTIVSDSFKDSPTYNADDSKNNFVIHVTHKIVPVTPDQPKTPTDIIPGTKQHYPTGVNTNDLNKDVQRSIFYKYEDNTQAEPTVVQKAHFDRTVKVDAVTQEIVDNGTWATKDNYPEIATKSIDGYTPDKTKVDSATPSMTTNQDQTVVYHANDEDAAITYIDDTTGKVLKTDTQKAKYKQAIKFATDPNTQIQTYKNQGYILVSSDWKDGSTYQTDPARNKFTVHLKHGTSTVTPDKPKKPTDIIPGTKQHYPTGVDTNDLNQPQQRQITYTYADSKKQASPTVTQKATFYRTATVDNVTGKTTYTDWTTSDQYPEVKSPTIEGYTPDRQTVPATKPELNQKQDVAVIYNPNPEQVDVIAQDNTGKQLSKSTLHGNYNTDYSATTPVVKGYHLIKMPANTHGTYKTHNDPIIYIYAPDSNSVPEQTDGTPKPDKSSYPNDLTPAKRSNKLPETGSINLQSELKSEIIKTIHNLI